MIGKALCLLAGGLFVSETGPAHVNTVGARGALDNALPTGQSEGGGVRIFSWKDRPLSI
jgi:hypothetical protein